MARTAAATDFLRSFDAWLAIDGDARRRDEELNFFARMVGRRTTSRNPEALAAVARDIVAEVTTHRNRRVSLQPMQGLPTDINIKLA